MLEYSKKLDDPNGIVSKLIFEDDTAITETVIYNYNDRGVICFSVQSGCPVGCSFCGTGNNFIRNLTADEIHLQIEEGLKLLKEKNPGKNYKKIELMAMSMGEPILNWGPVEINARKYLDKDYYFYISTIGIRFPDIMNRIIRLGQEYKKFGLQFSLHKTNDKDRFDFITNKKLPLMYIREMIPWAKKFNYYSGNKTYFNYIVTGKETDVEIRDLIKILPEMHLTCSVLCNIEDFIKADNKLATDFANKINKLSNGKIETSVFDPAGQDTIGGGCGQLLYVQEKLLGKKINIKVPINNINDKNIEKQS